MIVDDDRQTPNQFNRSSLQYGGSADIARVSEGRSEGECGWVGASGRTRKDKGWFQGIAGCAEQYHPSPSIVSLVGPQPRADWLTRRALPASTAFQEEEREITAGLLGSPSSPIGGIVSPQGLSTSCCKSHGHSFSNIQGTAKPLLYLLSPSRGSDQGRHH